MLASPTKTKEKPSIVSKKVLKTHHKNGTESYLLTEKIKTLEHKQSQKNIDINIEVNSLKKKMEAVQQVKEKISLSKERRMLLKSQGYTIRVSKGKKEDEIFLRRRDHDSLQVDAGNWATLLANPPDLPPQNESLEIQDVEESPEDCSSSSEKRPHDRMRSYSFSSAVDSRPTQVSRYRVIEPPLRPGSRRGFTLLSATPTPKTDHEIAQEFNDDFAMSSSERSPTPWDVLRNRPLSGRSLFVEAVIAARDSNYLANSQNLARERMENYRRRKLKTGFSRRTMSAPVIKMRPVMCESKDQKDYQRTSDNKEPQCTSEAKSHSNDQKNLANLKLDKVDILIEGKQETSENIRPTSEGNLINESKHGLNRDQKDGFCLSDASSFANIEKKDCSTQDSTGCFTMKQEGINLKGERNKEKSDASRQLINCNQKPNERSKNANKCNEFLPIQTSKMSNVEVDADVVNPVPLNGQEVGSSEDADENESFLKNKHEESACAVDSNTAVLETSGKTYLSVPDNTMTSRMSIRRHSSDYSEINYGNRDRNQCAGKDSQGKRHVTLQIPRSSKLNRRMSHPPRLASFQGDDKLRKRKTLKNEDEVVYAYDARPDKSLAKGYRAMQMTVGGRQVKINMPAFPKESGTILADRAKLNSKLSSFRGKSKNS